MGEALLSEQVMNPLHTYRLLKPADLKSMLQGSKVGWICVSTGVVMP